MDRPSALRTIVGGGLTVGVLDGAYAVISSANHGVSATRVFQYVASGALGRPAFSGGTTTALAGVGFHFLTAFLAATVFYFAARRFPALRRHFIVSGLVYGAVVQLVMRFVVVPLSAAPPLPWSLSGFLMSLLVHLLFVGLPIAWFARTRCEPGQPRTS